MFPTTATDVGGDKEHHQQQQQQHEQGDVMSSSGAGAGAEGDEPGMGPTWQQRDELAVAEGGQKEGEGAVSGVPETIKIEDFLTTPEASGGDDGGDGGGDDDAVGGGGGDGDP